MSAAPQPPARTPRAELTDAAVVSRSWGMALATLISRITGFIRIVLLAAIAFDLVPRSCRFAQSGCCPTHEGLMQVTAP